MFSAMKGGLVCTQCDQECHMTDWNFGSIYLVYAAVYCRVHPVENLYTFYCIGIWCSENLAMVMGRYMDVYVDKQFKSLEILEAIDDLNNVCETDRY